MKKPDLSAFSARLTASAVPLLRLIFGRYLIFLVMITAAIATRPVLLAIGNLDLLAYYSADPFRFGYLPQMLFGAFGLGLDDIGYVMVLFKAVYVLAVLLFGAVAAKWIKTEEDLRTRALRFVNLTVLCGIFHYTTRGDTFNMNAMLAAVMLTCAAYCLLHGKALPLVPVSIVLAQLFDLRTVMLLPALLLLPLLLRHTPAQKRRGVLAAAVTGALLTAALFAGMQLLSGRHGFQELAAYMGRGIPLFGEMLEGEENSLFSEFYCSFGTYSAWRYLLNGRGALISSVSDLYRYSAHPYPLFAPLTAMFLIGMIACLRMHKKVPHRLALLLTLLTAYLFFAAVATGQTMLLMPAAVCICILLQTQLKQPMQKTLFLFLGFTAAASVFFDAVSLFFAHSSDLFPLESPSSVSLTATQYYICWQDFGFVQRGLIGTAVRAWLGASIPAETFYARIPLLCLLFAAVLTAMMLLFARHAEKGEARRIILILLFAFFLSPAFNTHFYLYSYRLDLFFDVFGLLSVMLALRNRRSVWLIPLLCSAAMLTHQVFASLFFPAVFTALILRTFFYPEGQERRNLCVLFLTTAAVCGLFFWFTLAPSPVTMTPEEAAAYFQTRGGGFFEPHEPFVRYVLCENAPAERIRESHNAFAITELPDRLRMLAKAFFTTSPLLVMYLAAFLHSIRRQKDNLKKLAGIAACASLLAVVPVFYTDCDWGRWFSHYLFMLFTGILVLTRMQPENGRWYQTLPKPLIQGFLILTALSLILQPYYGILLLLQ